jgi:hypothetical protein
LNSFLLKDTLNEKFFADFAKLANLSSEDVVALAEFVSELTSTESAGPLKPRLGNRDPKRLLTFDELPQLISLVVFLRRRAEYAKPEEVTKEAIARVAEELFEDQRHRETFETLLNPVVEPSTTDGAGPGEPMDERDRAYAELLKQKEFLHVHLGDLLPHYGGLYIALHQGTVIASGADPEVVHREAHAALSASDILANKCQPVLIIKCEAPSPRTSGPEAIPGALKGLQG